MRSAGLEGPARAVVQVAEQQVALAEPWGMRAQSAALRPELRLELAFKAPACRCASGRRAQLLPRAAARAALRPPPARHCRHRVAQPQCQRELRATHQAAVSACTSHKGGWSAPAVRVAQTRTAQLCWAWHRSARQLALCSNASS
jgi:hypothetical protein